MSWPDRQDRWHRRLRRLLHPVDFQRRWFAELAAFYRHLSPEEFWLRYHTSRCEAKAMWAAGASPWDKTDYYVLRQALYHRDACWHAVAARLPRGGALLEYGCGIAPVSAWMAHRRPDAFLAIADVESRTLAFARWRLPKATVVPVDLVYGGFDAVVCYEVMEHVPDPVSTMQRLVGAVRPGGHLLLDFVADQGDGGAGPQARTRAMDYVRSMLDTITPLTDAGGRGVYVRR